MQSNVFGFCGKKAGNGRLKQRLALQTCAILRLDALCLMLGFDLVDGVAALLCVGGYLFDDLLKGFLQNPKARLLPPLLILIFGTAPLYKLVKEEFALCCNQPTVRCWLHGALCLESFHTPSQRLLPHSTLHIARLSNHGFLCLGQISKLLSWSKQGDFDYIAYANKYVSIIYMCMYVHRHVSRVGNGPRRRAKEYKVEDEPERNNGYSHRKRMNMHACFSQWHHPFASQCPAEFMQRTKSPPRRRSLHYPHHVGHCILFKVCISVKSHNTLVVFDSLVCEYIYIYTYIYL